MGYIQGASVHKFSKSSSVELSVIDIPREYSLIPLSCRLGFARNPAFQSKRKFLFNLYVNSYGLLSLLQPPTSRRALRVLRPCHRRKLSVCSRLKFCKANKNHEASLLEVCNKRNCLSHVRTGFPHLFYHLLL